MKTASEIILMVVNGSGEPTKNSSAFICPYPDCKAYAQHFWGVVRNVLTPPINATGAFRLFNGNRKLVTSFCTNCHKEAIFFGNSLIVPAVSQAPAPNGDLPPELAGDYEEARKVLPISPRSAAALLRLVVQKLLPIIGAKEDDINKMIGELVAKGTISPVIQKALDSVRVIGNEAVHPGVMDLKDNHTVATSLFNLINFIVEKSITEPKEVAAIFAGLPKNKLEGIANRDKQ